MGLWDCGTGNGQAAVDLASRYAKVWATDPSESQIANATKHPRVHYVVGTEKQLLIADSRIDLVTVAQAIHWFDLNTFYEEVRRVSRQGAKIAVWAYDFNEPIQVDIDRILRRLYFDTLGPYWASNNKLIWDGYQNLPFPFFGVERPQFCIEADMNLLDFAGYLSSWSSSTKFQEKNGFSAIETVFKELTPLWGEPTALRRLSWKLHMLVGTVHP